MSVNSLGSDSSDAAPVASMLVENPNLRNSLVEPVSCNVGSAKSLASDSSIHRHCINDVALAIGAGCIDVGLIASMSVERLRSDSSNSNWFVCINVRALAIDAGCIDVSRMAPVRFFRFELVRLHQCLVASMSVKWLRSDSSDSNWLLQNSLVGTTTLQFGLVIRCCQVNRVRFLQFGAAVWVRFLDSAPLDCTACQLTGKRKNLVKLCSKTPTFEIP
jgi:hypothetical protein